ncbi:hypothetical protein SAMN02746062_00174 [Alysiella filiformis DSM 16848]|uniref:Uncharacterized protein n=1 Tax=Alysiella filiformis DSM 16848 TaxID=1120981 RepID=A0A286E2C2_9NEIS|nr:hypothetical protein SAMN02746062_00174 [Alysiella filiformis DSM 16848]
MRVNATHWRVFLTQKLAILMKKQSRNELSLAPSNHKKFRQPTHNRLPEYRFTIISLDQTIFPTIYRKCHLP